MQIYCYITKKYHKYGELPTYCKGNCKYCIPRKGRINVLKQYITTYLRRD